MFTGQNIIEEDVQFEVEILRNAYSTKHWLRYIDHKSKSPIAEINMVYERALKELPRSYKIWIRYIRTRIKQTRNKSILDDINTALSQCFEKALVYMNKMPRIWIEYCTHMTNIGKITNTRHIFDRSLRALPITQHNRIWPLYINFINKYDIPETGIRIYRRYLKYSPEDVEEFIVYLLERKKLNQAAIEMVNVVDNDFFSSKFGKSSHQIWNELCLLISNNPSEIKSVNVNAIIRSGLRQYTDELGHLWNSLANYYIRSGLFERARDVYEEAIKSVNTVRDFTQIFDAYAQFEELSLGKKMEEIPKDGTCSNDVELEIELRLVRFEHLMERRLLLLNSVLLRQNPHNVNEWHKRVELFDGKPIDIIETYSEAVQTVQPKLAVGKLYTLWVEFAKFYEKNEQVDDARIVFEKGSQVNFAKVDDLAFVWCEWVEMEIRQNDIKRAMKLLQRATAIPKHNVSYHDESLSVQTRLYKSLKLWSLYADLEESFGNFKACKCVYEKIIDLRICTPQIIINYGLFLEDNKYYEEAFKAYEKGIGLFKWPNVFDIWSTYITKFIDRYGGKKLERARDLFEQCISDCPPEYAKYFFLLYAKLEEDFGLARHAMSVYNRATKNVKENEMFEIFVIFIKKASKMFGVTRTREIYESAIECLPDEHSRIMCIRYSEMETKLGEIDRARAIYAHCSQMNDPRINSSFWQQWKEFEINHGNEDTMREMLRIKRSVFATFNTQINMMSAQIVKTNNESDIVNPMEALDKSNNKTANIMFVRGETQGGTKNNKDAVINPEEIDIDDDFETDDFENHQIPSKVFGKLKSSNSS